MENKTTIPYGNMVLIEHIEIATAPNGLIIKRENESCKIGKIMDVGDNLWVPTSNDQFLIDQAQIVAKVV